MNLISIYIFFNHYCYLILAGGILSEINENNNNIDNGLIIPN